MQRKLVVPAVLAILAVAAALFFLLRDDGASRLSLTADDASRGAGNDGLEPLETVTSDVAEGSSVSSSATGDTVAATASEIAGNLLFGRVVDDEGNSVVGATIILRPESSFWGGFRRGSGGADRMQRMRDRALGKVEASRDRVAARTQTDGEGRYSFSIASLPRVRFQVLALMEGLAPGSESWSWVPETSQVDFELGLGAWISGIVVAPDGSPVEGAAVEAYSESGERRGWGRGGESSQLAGESESDAEGRFRLSVGNLNYSLNASIRGYSSASSKRIPPGSDEVVLQLGPSRNILGSAVDENGSPVPGVQISLYRSSSSGRGGGRGGGWQTTALQRRMFASPENQAFADKKGRFRFDDLEAGSYTIMAEMSSYEPVQTRVELSEEMESSDVTVTLSEGRVLKGRVADPDGDPVAGAVVVIGKAGSDSSRGWGRGSRNSAQDNERKRRKLQEEGRLDELQEFEERLAREEEQKRRRPVSMFMASRAIETDARGQFAIDTLAKMQYDVSVEADNFVTFREEKLDLESENQELEVVLAAGIRLVGNVVSSTTKEPVAGAQISLRRGREESRTLETNEDGEYSIGGLVDGDSWSMTVDRKGYKLEFFDDVSVEATPVVQSLDIEIDPSARVSGKVVDASGQPVPGARVRIREASENRGWSEGSTAERMQRFREFRRQGARSVEKRTGASGVFVLEDVHPAPNMQIKVTHADYKDNEGEVFEVSPGERIADLTIEMDAGSRLLVTVAGTDGAISGARIRMRKIEPKSEEREGRAEGGGIESGRGGRERGSRGRRGGFGRRGGESISRTSDAMGHAKFSGIEGGNYTLYTETGGHQPFSTLVSLAEGESSDFAIQLLPENLITGIVSDTMGQPIERASIRARAMSEDPDTGRRHETWARSGDDGSFRLGSLGPGPYGLSVERRGYTRGRLEDVAVNTEQRISLQRLASIAGWAFAMEGGQPITRFEISLRPDKSTASAAEKNGRTAGGNAGVRGRRERGGRERVEGGRRERVKDDEGAFFVDNIQPGSYVLEVTAGGYTSASRKIRVEEGEALEGIEMKLLEGLAISGIVQDRSGRAPLSGAQIYLLPFADPNRGSESESGENQSVEERRSRRSREGRGVGRRESRNSREQDVAAAVATLAGLRRQSAQLESDEQGHFRLEDLAEGVYTLLVSHDAYLPFQQIVEVREDRSQRELSVRLESGESVRGTIKKGRRDSGGGMTLIFEGANGLQRETMTDASGKFNLTGFLPGSYNVKIRGGGASIATTSFTVKEGKNNFKFDIPEE